jgi:hypothetical protein
VGYDGDQQVKYYVRIYFIIIIVYISTHHDNNIPIRTHVRPKNHRQNWQTRANWQTRQTRQTLFPKNQKHVF